MKPIYLKCSTCGDTTHDINAVFCFKCTTETLEPIYKNPTPPDERIKAIAENKHIIVGPNDMCLCGVAPNGEPLTCHAILLTIERLQKRIDDGAFGVRNDGYKLARVLMTLVKDVNKPYDYVPQSTIAPTTQHKAIAEKWANLHEPNESPDQRHLIGCIESALTEATQPLQKELDEAKKENLRLHKWSQEWEQQVSTLRTELTKLKQQLDDAKAQERAAQKGARINALVNQESAKTINLLRQQLAEAVKDTQRLDWLEQYLIAGNDLRIFASDNPTSTIGSRGDTGIIIRTAISAAMNNPTKEEK